MLRMERAETTTTEGRDSTMSVEDISLRVDELMAEATRLQDEGKWAEADTVISEAENLEDREWDTAPRRSRIFRFGPTK